MKQIRNIVLVHGAWADGSCWNKVIARLQEKGFFVTAVQLPLSSLEADVAVTQHAIAAQDGPTVLVGHSYGGAVITNAAKVDTNVKELVYIAAFGLDQGESLESLSKQGPPPPGSAHVRPDDFGRLWLDREGYKKFFAADVDPIEAGVMAATQNPLSIKSFSDKSGPPAWKKIPSFYLVSDHDQMIPPQAQAFMGKRMGAVVHHVPASHVSMVSHPKEVADIILLAAGCSHEG